MQENEKILIKNKNKKGFERTRGKSKLNNEDF